MTKRNSDILLLIALLFSHFFVYQLNIGSHIQTEGIKIKLFPLFGFAGNESSNHTWTSVIIGYLIFCIYLFVNFEKGRQQISRLYIMVLGFAILSVLFEFYTIWLIFKDNFIGQYSRLGLALYFLCVGLSTILYKTEEKRTINS